MNFKAILFLMLTLLLIQGNNASSGVLEKKTNKNSVFDRLYQSDYIYFISGDPNTKVNFSFGFELSKRFELDLEFNQTMFWELSKESMPFRDINFNPKIVKRTHYGRLLVDLGIYEHHSNGVDGIESRSYDSSYIYPKYLLTFPRFNIYLGVKARAFYRLGEYNQNIEKYIGNIELSMASTFYLSSDHNESFKLNLTSSPGGDYDDLYSLGYNKIDFIYDPGWIDFPVNIHTQIYSGFGESLLGFNQKNTSYRIGLSI